MLLTLKGNQPLKALRWEESWDVDRAAYEITYFLFHEGRPMQWMSINRELPIGRIFFGVENQDNIKMTFCKTLVISANSIEVYGDAEIQEKFDIAAE